MALPIRGLLTDKGVFLVIPVFQQSIPRYATWLTSTQTVATVRPFLRLWRRSVTGALLGRKPGCSSRRRTPVG
jgi:hypothetical protein